MKNRRGQALTEMVVIIPLILMLAGGVSAVVYICWQGIRVQQSANFAARIQGQERVAGGVSLSTIQQDNGTASTLGDADPTQDPKAIDSKRYQALSKSSKQLAPADSVYGRVQRAVRSFFGTSEQQGLFIPLPKYGVVGYSDQVKVVRLWQPPSFFGLNLNPIELWSTAYGGEDTHMYGLIRWGSTSQNGSNGGKFWTDPNNLPNPNND